MIVLGIESTCDETAAAIVEDGNHILSNVIASQTDLHKNYGGVFPELACRGHVDIIIPIIKKALDKARLKPTDIDLIAVSSEPGLIGALLIGLNTAKALAYSWNIPFVGVNHIEAHLYAAMMNGSVSESAFPALGVVLSGGHTSLIKIHNVGEYEPIAETVDDAIGEAFDKVARLLDLPYPGGPEIEKLAEKGNPNAYSLTAGRVKKDPLSFSFSGIKTQVLYLLKGQNAQNEESEPLDLQKKADIAASFQKTVFDDVLQKTFNAARQHNCSSIFLGGGVTNSRALRQLFGLHSPPTLNIFFPDPLLSLDNAAMIAGLGYHTFLKKGSSKNSLTPSPRSTCLFPSKCVSYL